ncbi:hypothetical protein PG995_010611 [Apiospora arundinis]
MLYAVNRDECLSPALCFVADTNTLRKQPTSLGYFDEPFPDDSPGDMADAISAKKKLVIVTIDFGTSKSAQQYVILESHEIEDRSKVCLDDVKSGGQYHLERRTSSTGIGTRVWRHLFPVHMIDEEDQKHRVITVLLKGWQRIGVVEESDERTPRSVQQDNIVKGVVLDGLASSRLRVPVRRAFEIHIAQIEKGQNPNEPPDGGKCQIM